MAIEKKRYYKSQTKRDKEYYKLRRKHGARIAKRGKHTIYIRE